jgi:hypothetical protein
MEWLQYNDLVVINLDPILVQFLYITFINLGFCIWLPSILAADNFCVFWCEFAFVILNNARVYRSVLLIRILNSLAIYLKFGHHVVRFLLKVDFWLVNFDVWQSWFAIVAFHCERALIVAKVELNFHSFAFWDRFRWSYRVLIWFAAQLLNWLRNIYFFLNYLWNNIRSYWHNWFKRHFFLTYHAGSWGCAFRLNSFIGKLDLCLDGLFNFVSPYPLDVFKKLS